MKSRSHPSDFLVASKLSVDFTCDCPHADTPRHRTTEPASDDNANTNRNTTSLLISWISPQT